MLKTSQDSSQCKWFSVSLFTTVFLACEQSPLDQRPVLIQATVFFTSLNYCQSWIQEIKNRCVSCLIDLWGQSFPWHIVTCCEQVNPASANGRTTLYLQTLQWAFPVVSRKLLTKLKRKPIAKQNVIFSLELRSTLEIQRALAFYLNIFLFIGMNSVLFSRSYHSWPKRNMRVCMGKIEFETLMK